MRPTELRSDQALKSCLSAPGDDVPSYQLRPIYRGAGALECRIKLSIQRSKGYNRTVRG